MSLTNTKYIEAVEFLLNYTGLADFKVNLDTYFHQGDYELTLTKTLEVDRYDTELQSQMQKFSEEVIDQIESSRLVQDVLAREQIKYTKLEKENQLLKEQVNQLISVLGDV
jgi:transcription initiation factor IIF auxiliary subunit